MKGHLNLLFLLFVIYSQVKAQSHPYAFPKYFSSNMNIITEDFEIITIFHSNYETHEQSINQQYRFNANTTVNEGKPRFEIVQQTLYYNLTGNCEYNYYSEYCDNKYNDCSCDGYFRDHLPLPQYPVGIPDKNFKDKVNGINCIVYYNSTMKIAFAIDEISGVPVALIGAYGTNDQTSYFFMNAYPALPPNSFIYPCKSNYYHQMNNNKGKTSNDISSLFSNFHSNY